MRKNEYDVPVRICKVLNVILMAICFAAVWYGYYADRALVKYYRRGDWVVIFLFAILYFGFCRSYDAFHISTSPISELIYSQGLSLVIADFALYMVIWLLSLHMPNVLPMLLVLAAQLLVSVLWAFLSHKWYFSNYRPRETAVIYDAREGMESLIGEYGLEKKFKIEHVLQVKECLKSLSVLDGCDTVFLAGIHSHDRNIILKYCMYRGIRVYVIPRVGDVIMGGAKQIHMFHLPMMQIERYHPIPEYVLAKRFFDILLSGIALIVLSPFILVTAIAVKSDGGPALYKQKRLTKDGRVFNVLKFRSMRVDAEKDGVARLSTGDKDDRITPVGKVIRKIRFDELPQLFNILRGDMSIVGPRPERPEIAAQYEKEMPEFALRLQAKAGLTGYAQVYGKYNTTPYDKLLMDLTYIGRPSLWEDFKICLATVKILFMPESTEGVAEGMTTAMGEKKS
ncbi:MAG: exopolysaccharide biosynthesis polyprenyl glycosylphosphotransferase [Firmicutes bacterium]|nr:exopolysaccharide biosynthesis polyprenyl glycosylphosphotransferase [Bacillota bacterium]